MYGTVQFQNDGNIYAIPATYDRTKDIKLMPYKPGTWYSIKINIDLDAKVFDVYIDGVLKVSHAAIEDEGFPTGIEISATHNSNRFFKTSKIYTCV